MNTLSSNAVYLFMAGGTGGHIFPALAVAEELRERGASIYWLGTASGMENVLVPKHGIDLHSISIKGFRGKGLLKKISTPFLLLKAVMQAVFIIRKLTPDVIIGFGGYVAAPGGIAAYLLRKPLIIHEQNSVAGSTNKLLAKLASKKLEAFSGSLIDAILLGNPVRKAVCRLFDENKGSAKVDDSENIRKVLNVLIMGGSLGAEAINKAVPQAIAKLPEELVINIWHQTGKGKLQQVAESYKELEVDARTNEFIDDVTQAYQWADVIICRAGALTVSEVAIAGLPAIFIPYPHAIDNHQVVNAQWLVNNNAANMIEQSDLTAGSLADNLKSLLMDKEKIQSYSQALKELAMPHATKNVADICEQIYLDKTTKRESRHAN